MSNETEDRSPTFNRAILARIVAVLAFVCLGTFAVIQSVIGDKEPDPKTELVQTDVEQVADEKDKKLVSIAKQSKLEQQSLVDPPKIGSQPKPENKSAFSEPKEKPDSSFKSRQLAGKSPAASNGFGGFDQSPTQFGGNAPKKKEPASANSRFSAQLKSESSPPSVPSRQVSTARPPIVNSIEDGSKDGPQATQANPKPPQDRFAQLGGFGGTKKDVDPPNPNPSPNPNEPNKQPKTDLRAKSSFAAEDLRQPARKLQDNVVDIARQKANEKANQIDNRVGRALDALKPVQEASSGTDFNRQTTGTKVDRNDDLRPLRSPNSFDNSPNPMRNAPPTSQSVFERQPPATNLPPANQQQRPIAETPPQITRQDPGSFGNPNLRNQSPMTPRNSDSVLSKSPLPPTNIGISAQQSSAPKTNSILRNSMAPANVGTSSSLAASVGQINTQPTPGDRQLEGAQTPSLTIEKVAPREIQVNQLADFKIIVRNSGRVSADQVQVFDQVPTGAELIQADPQPQRGSNGKISWDLGTMRPGQEKLIKLQLRPTQHGEMGSVAHVTFATQASMRTIVTKPELTITHSGPTKTLIGSDVILDILVENRGDGPASEVVIQEDVPEQLSFQNGFRELEYEIGTLAPGQSRKIRLSLKAAKIGRMKNLLFASAKGGLKAQHSIDMEIIAPQLTSSASGPSRRFLRREATHSFAIENHGTANATNVELTAKLPRGLRFVGANNRGQYDANAHSVYWSLAELTPDVAANVEVTTMPIEAGDQSIVFDAQADLGQNTETSHQLLVEHLIDVSFDIDDQVDPIEIGSSTSYQVRLVNQGTKVATNVRFQLDFPPGILPTGVQGNLANEIRGQTVVFAPITSLDPGDDLKFVITGKGITPGDHRVVLRMQTDGRETGVSKEETTRVYNDR